MTESELDHILRLIISTHILTKRMTRLFFLHSLQGNISTHILTKRMTLLDTDRKVSDGYFNSHPHEEDDNIQLSFSLLCNPFQLTSSRRGWRNWTEEVSAANYFNSHPHEEDDVVCKNIFIVLFLFQLTSSRRGWRLRSDRNVYIRNFNSHPHEEDDCSA